MLFNCLPPIDPESQVFGQVVVYQEKSQYSNCTKLLSCIGKMLQLRSRLLFHPLSLSLFTFFLSLCMYFSFSLYLLTLSLFLSLFYYSLTQYKYKVFFLHILSIFYFYVSSHNIFTLFLLFSSVFLSLCVSILFLAIHFSSLSTFYLSPESNISKFFPQFWMQKNRN